MAIINFLAAQRGLNKIADKYESADEQVGAAVKKFIAQLTMISTMNAVGSVEGQLLGNIIETADSPENTGDPEWVAMKAKANHAKADLAERLQKYNDALEPVLTLRG